MRILPNDENLVMWFIYLFIYFLSVGGLKLWEGSLDLVKALRSEIQNGCLSFEGKRVLEVGSDFQLIVYGLKYRSTSITLGITRY